MAPSVWAWSKAASSAGPPVKVSTASRVRGPAPWPGPGGSVAGFGVDAVLLTPEELLPGTPEEREREWEAEGEERQRQERAQQPAPAPGCSAGTSSGELAMTHAVGPSKRVVIRHWKAADQVGLHRRAERIVVSEPVELGQHRLLAQPELGHHVETRSKRHRSSYRSRSMTAPF